MNIIETPLKDCYIIENKIFNDQRGYFYEFYNQNNFNAQVKIPYNFVQDNISFSAKGTLRGLHFQHGEYAQTKLVSVLQGEVWDVAVDVRKNSPSYKKWFGVLLSEQNKRQFLIPKGFAHGFIVLSEQALFFYKCDQFYHPAADAGIIYNDPDLNIDWKLTSNEIIISEKDAKLPSLKDSPYIF